MSHPASTDSNTNERLHKREDETTGLEGETTGLELARQIAAELRRPHLFEAVAARVRVGAALEIERLRRGDLS